MPDPANALIVRKSSLSRSKIIPKFLEISSILLEDSPKIAVESRGMKRVREYSDGGVDSGLLVLLETRAPERELTQEEIAFVCGCSKGYIWNLEKRAMNKLRKEFEKLRHEGKLRNF